MTAASTVALETLRRMARGHAGASSGEVAAWEILGNFGKEPRWISREISCAWIVAVSGR